MSKKPVFTTVDEYIAEFPSDVKSILEKIRAIVHREAPEVTEGISYEIPVFNVDGEYLIYMAGWKEHVSLYPVSAAMEKAVPGVSEYISGRGTIKFPLKKPIPYDLIEKIVRFKVEEKR
jgi:uncharacterized protein YdhG (YjbR/CyaY superfamily)